MNMKVDVKNIEKKNEKTNKEMKIRTKKWTW